MSIFSQEIHLKGFHGDQIDLRHTHGRRQQQQGQALQAGSWTLQLEYGTCFMSIFSQGIHLKGFHGDQIDLRHTHGRRQQQLVQALQKSSSIF